MTLTEAITKWITRREITLAASTISGYRRLCRLYVEPTEAGAVPLDELTEDHMIDLLRPLLSADHTRQAQLLQILVGAVLRDAVRHRWIDFNPMEGVDRVRHKSAFTAWLTLDQARQLLKVTRDDPWYPAWLLMICCGLRRGEMLALRWDDIDLEQKILRIRRQRVRIDRVDLETRPKSESGKREIPLDDTLITELRLIPRRGSRILGNVTGDQMAYALDAAIRRAGVPRVTPHGLRHTMAAAAASQGIPIKTLQTLMGHAHYTTTADIYAHVDQTSRRAACAALARAVPARLEIV